MEPELAAERTGASCFSADGSTFTQKWIDLGAESTRHRSLNERRFTRGPRPLSITTRNLASDAPKNHYSKYYYDLSQPLLFRRLIFQLFVSIFNVFYPSHCQQLYGERPHMVLNQNFAEKRVEFVIFSPWISSAIRSVGVLPTDDRSYCGNMEDSDAVLFMTIIDSLPLLFNLSSASVLINSGTVSHAYHSFEPSASPLKNASLRFHHLHHLP